MQIGKITFTGREIDIISCILNSRGAKKIANILLISPRTVETHIQNILIKIGGNSQEAIIDFIEQSGQFKVIKEHYLSLLITSIFERQLRQAAHLIKKYRMSCVIICSEEESKDTSLQQIIKHLKIAGLGIIITKDNLSTQNLENSCNYRNIYLLSQENIDSLLLNGSFEIKKNDILLVKDSATQILISKKPLGVQIGKNIINLSTKDQYFQNVFHILKELIIEIDITPFISEFQKIKESIITSKGESFSELLINNQKSQEIEQGNINRNSTLIFNKKKTKIFFIFIVIALSGAVSYSNEIKQYFLPIIKMDLILPDENVLIKREELLKETDNRIKTSDKGIKIITLTGIGGSGKTTLARQYGRLTNSKLLWEINAETEHSLLNSFELLAYTLCTNKQDQEKLSSIKNIISNDERRNKLMLFVSTKIKVYDNWLLIYDNLENLAHITEYLPHDPKIWGTGIIIITTRNSNIGNNSFIQPQNVISVGELNESEKFELFSKIAQGSEHKSLQNKILINEFLKHIPSAPLDVSVAAYYINNSKISYDTYLRHISEFNKKLSNTQEDLLEEISGQYTASQYKIINLSIQSLLQENTEFFKTLLFISMIDSQNIPGDLLIFDNNLTNTHNFIHNMKKYSLINEMNNSSFSIHRSTQDIILSYLSKYQISSDLLLSLASQLQVYMDKEIDRFHDQTKMKLLIPHAEQFLNQQQVPLPDIAQAIVSHALGNYYYHIYLYDKAKELLGYTVNIYKKHYETNNISTGRVLVQLGGVYISTGEYNKAKELLEEGVKIYKLYYNEDGHEDISWSLVRLASVYQSLGRYEKSINLLEEAIRIYKKNSSEERRTAWALVHLGNVYINTGDYNQALESLEKAVSLHREIYGERHFGTIWSSIHLGSVYRNMGNLDRAKHILENAFEVYSDTYGSENIETAWASLKLAALYKDSGNYNQAIKLTKSALKIYKEYYGETHIKTAKALLQIGQIELLENNIETSKNLITEAAEIFNANKHIDIYTCFESLADLYSYNYRKHLLPPEKRENYLKLAKDYLNKALFITTNNFGQDSNHANRLRNKLAKL